MIHTMADIIVTLTTIMVAVAFIYSVKCYVTTSERIDYCALVMRMVPPAALVRRYHHARRACWACGLAMVMLVVMT